MARVPLRDPEDLPEDDRHLLYAAGEGERTLDVFRALGNNPPVLRSFRRYFNVLWTESGLTERERELVILAVARRAGSTYEWHQHVRLARDVGVADDAIRAVSSEDWSALTEREAQLLRYAEAVVDDRVEDDLHDRAAATLDERTLVGVALLAVGYDGLARALSAFGVEPEDGFVGWDLEGS